MRRRRKKSGAARVGRHFEGTHGLRIGLPQPQQGQPDKEQEAPEHGGSEFNHG